MGTATYCPQCGTAVEREANFCTSCGHPLRPETTSPLASTPPAVPAASDERMWAILVHLAAFGGAVFPFGNVVGPLVIWLVQRARMPLVDAHGREALNFQISASLYLVVCIVLIFLVIGLLLLPALVIFWLVIVVRAAVRTSNGQQPDYKLTIRFLQ